MVLGALCAMGLLFAAQPEFRILEQMVRDIAGQTTTFSTTVKFSATVAISCTISVTGLVFWVRSLRRRLREERRTIRSLQGRLTEAQEELEVRTVDSLESQLADTQKKLKALEGRTIKSLESQLAEAQKELKELEAAQPKNNKRKGKD